MYSLRLSPTGCGKKTLNIIASSCPKASCVAITRGKSVHFSPEEFIHLQWKCGKPNPHEENKRYLDPNWLHTMPTLASLWPSMHRDSSISEHGPKSHEPSISLEFLNFYKYADQMDFGVRFGDKKWALITESLKWFSISFVPWPPWCMVR